MFLLLLFEGKEGGLFLVPKIILELIKIVNLWESFCLIIIAGDTKFIY